MRIRPFRSLLAICLVWSVIVPASGLAMTPTPTPDTSTDDLETHVVYVVAFLNDDVDDLLAVRSQAGDGDTAVQIGSLVNGDSVELAGETQVGWVKRDFLAGNLDPELFCADQRVASLIVALDRALDQQDSAAFAALVSPRGLYMSFRGGQALLLLPEEVSGFFEDDRTRNWGNNGYSGVDFIGSLAEDVIPLWIEDFASPHLVTTCNDNQDTLSIRSILHALYIDYRYPITNFYTVMRPGAPQHELEWRAWGLAIDYWDRQPRLMGIAGYGWAP